METKPLLQCVELIGDLDHLGKHAHFIEMGVTMCGCFTNDYNKDSFKNMPENVTSDYNKVEWDITCPRCLEIMDMMQNITEAKKVQQN